MTNREKVAQEFGGRNLIITGAAGDIGKTVAHHMGSLGAAIGLVDIDGAKLSQVRAELEAKGIRCVAVTCDVTQAEQVRDAIGQVSKELGPLTMLFNNAGIQGTFTPTATYPEDDFEAVIRVNVIGAFNMLKGFVRHASDHGDGGSVVNTASMAAVGGPPNMLAYATSKAAILGMTQTASRDCAPLSIRVNAISPAYMGPGFMWTRQVELQAAAGSQYFSEDPDTVARQMIDSIPMRRYGDISEIPHAVAFLLGGGASYITGVNIPIAGGIF